MQSRPSGGSPRAPKERFYFVDEFSSRVLAGDAAPCEGPGTRRKPPSGKTEATPRYSSPAWIMFPLICESGKYTSGLLLNCGSGERLSKKNDFRDLYPFCSFFDPGSSRAEGFFFSKWLLGERSPPRPGCARSGSAKRSSDPSSHKKGAEPKPRPFPMFACFRLSARGSRAAGGRRCW